MKQTAFDANPECDEKISKQLTEMREEETQEKLKKLTDKYKRFRDNQEKRK